MRIIGESATACEKTESTSDCIDCGIMCPSFLAGGLKQVALTVLATPVLRIVECHILGVPALLAVDIIILQGSVNKRLRNREIRRSNVVAIDVT